jgi:hypothetical protein
MIQIFNRKRKEKRYLEDLRAYGAIILKYTLLILEGVG